MKNQIKTILSLLLLGALLSISSCKTAPKDKPKEEALIGTTWSADVSSVIEKISVTMTVVAKFDTKTTGSVSVSNIKSEDLKEHPIISMLPKMIELPLTYVYDAQRKFYHIKISPFLLGGETQEGELAAIVDWSNNTMTFYEVDDLLTPLFRLKYQK